jgi:hypothetical protein
MAQRSPIRLDADRSHYVTSDVDWSELRATPSRSEYRRSQRRPLPLGLWMVLAVFIGTAAVVYYMKFLYPSGATSPTTTSTADAPTVSVGSGRSSTKTTIRNRARSVATSPGAPQLQSSPAASLARALPVVPPAAYIDVVTSGGHLPIRIDSIAYRVDVTAGTVELIHSGAGSPVVLKTSFSVTPAARQALESTIEETVVLRVLADKLGRVREWHVVSGQPALAAAAIDALRQWRFASADDHPPAARELTVTVSFKTSP